MGFLLPELERSEAQYTLNQEEAAAMGISSWDVLARLRLLDGFRICIAILLQYCNRGLVIGSRRMGGVAYDYLVRGSW